jgi:predicted dehydrogenase
MRRVPGLQQRWRAPGEAQINAVCIATPVRLGVSQTVAAARAGKQLLIEEPTAISTSECETMI